MDKISIRLLRKLKFIAGVRKHNYPNTSVFEEDFIRMPLLGTRRATAILFPSLKLDVDHAVTRTLETNTTGFFNSVKPDRFPHWHPHPDKNNFRIKNKLFSIKIPEMTSFGTGMLVY